MILVVTGTTFVLSRNPNATLEILIVAATLAVRALLFGGNHYIDSFEGVSSIKAYQRAPITCPTKKKCVVSSLPIRKQQTTVHQTHKNHCES